MPLNYQRSIIENILTCAINGRFLLSRYGIVKLDNPGSQNNLPDEVANAPSISTFKNRLHEHCKDQDILYYYKVTLGTSVTRKGDEISIGIIPESYILKPETQIIQVSSSNMNIQNVYRIQEAVEIGQMSPTEEDIITAATPARNYRDVNKIRGSGAPVQQITVM